MKRLAIQLPRAATWLWLTFGVCLFAWGCCKGWGLGKSIDIATAWNDPAIVALGLVALWRWFIFCPKEKK